jgi:hypothetical protein
MTKEWWASANGEDYTVGPSGSRDEVIADAQSDDCGYDYDFHKATGHHKVSFYVALCEPGEEREEADGGGFYFKSCENEELLTFLADEEGDFPPYHQIPND